MPLPRRARLAVIAVIATAALLALGSPSGAAAGPPVDRHLTGAVAPAEKAPTTDRTTAREAARVDAVPTPTLRWHRCTAPEDGSYEIEPTYGCTSVALPLDYDRPHGPQIRVALLKVPATDPAHRIGSLFLNPGGPGGSGQSIAARAASFLSPSVRARFDLIGMDPRGTNASTRVRCYPDQSAQARDTDVLDTVFPVGATEEAVYVRAAGRLAHTCSTTGRPLSAAMSTAEVARDLDVLRRAVGDRRLSFLGWSYGTYLGQVYAGLFPDRVRAVAIDGVVDAAAWRGRPGSTRPMTVRLDSARGSSLALTTLLRRCQRAGADICPLMPDPQAAFDGVARRLQARPLTVTDEDGSTYQITYAGFLHDILLALYLPEVAQDVPAAVAFLQELIDADTTTATRRRATTGYLRLAARTDALTAPAAPTSGAAAAVASAALDSAPTTNAYELNAAVACSDSHNPTRSARWSELAAHEDRRAPYFGRFWLWASAVCARWTAPDEDAYAGPLDRRTAHGVLVVGNVYDPATSYESAVAVARRLPGSRLVRSSSWGHTAYGTSACVTGAVDAYLVAGTLPARGIHCVGDVQPFG